jgi:predicted Ser/Thr protein kinase
MTALRELILSLSAEDAASVESLLVDFDRGWHEGLLADAHRRLSSCPARARRPALVEMVKIDLERRWQKGGRPRLEDYLRDYPDLAGRGGVPTDLIQAEVRVRREAGESIDPGDLARRFPSQAAALAGLLQGQETVPPAPTGTIPAAAAPAHQPADAPGQLPEGFGRYRIQRRLGRGGMGTVYLALDTELDRRVALKVPSADTGGNPELIERLLREARAAAALRHPNVCPVYDVGRINDVPYLTMAYIEGRTLQEVLGAGKRPGPAQSAALVRKLALALQEAHALGLVHRDLKPSNIMIDRTGQPVVMDFGLVRRTGATDVQLTQSGAMLGTPSFMAPEQVTGDLAAVGPATDVYGLGVILYLLLAGEMPFIGPLHAVLAQVLTQDPVPPSRLRPGLDAGLDAICLKAMAKKPADRYPSMTALAAALKPFTAKPAAAPPQGEPMPANPPPAAAVQPAPAKARRGRRLAGALAIGALVVVAAAMAAALFSARPGKEAVVTTSAASAPQSSSEKTAGVAPAQPPAPPQTARPQPASGEEADALIKELGGSSQPRETKAKTVPAAADGGGKVPAATPGREHK